MARPIVIADQALQPLRPGEARLNPTFDRNAARLQFHFSLICLGALVVALGMVLMSRPGLL